jgi:hypothetical protein
MNMEKMLGGLERNLRAKIAGNLGNIAMEKSARVG